MKEQSVIKYYLICHRLKDTIRTGWQNWNVKRNRIETVAEHIYGTQMLAIAMKSEYQYDIDIMKVIYMLAIHELAETVIGDLTLFQISKEEKERIEKNAVKDILSSLIDGKQIEELLNEFNEQTTAEALFAFQCDKLECDIQCKLYDQEGCVDLNKQDGNQIVNNEFIKTLLDKGYSWSKMWIEFDQNRYNYDSNFMAISNYIKNNDIDDNN